MPKGRESSVLFGGDSRPESGPRQSQYAGELPLPTCASCISILVLKHQYANPWGVLIKSRLTITLSDARYRALKEASARRDKTIGQLIDESLEYYGIKTLENALAIVERARRHSGLSEAQAMALATGEVKAARKR